MVTGPDGAAPDVLEVPAPRLSREQALEVAERVFGLRVASARELESERDQNFRLRDTGGRELVLKIANAAEDPSVFDFQTRALEHVERCAPELPVPRVVPTAAGESSRAIEGPDGQRHWTRLVSYLPGRMLAEATLSPELLASLGTTLARLGRALRGFFHPAAGHVLLWDLKHAARLRLHLGAIADPEARALADRWLRRFEQRVLPLLPRLRAQVIHNDLSRHNTVVDESGNRVVGVIDFGDLVHAPLIHDVAVAVSEVMLGAADPVAAAEPLVAAYDRAEPLRDDERSLLFELVAARLAMGAVVSAWRVERHPGNRDYITGDDPLLWPLLARLDELEGALRGALLGAGARAT